MLSKLHFLQIGGMLLSVGERHQNQINCTECQCTSSTELYCGPIGCPQLDCSHPIHVPGQCCPRCGESVISFLFFNMYYVMHKTCGRASSVSLQQNAWNYLSFHLDLLSIYVRILNVRPLIMKVVRSQRVFLGL